MKWMINSSLARTVTALVMLVTLWPTLVMALPLQEAGIVTTLSGKASVTRINIPQSLPLQFKAPVYLGDKISTAEDSIVRVLLGGKALVTVRELSVFSITEKVGKSTINLGRGKISLAVARQRMSPGESVEVRTPNAVAAVRGTVLVVEVEPAPTAAAIPGSALTSSTVTVIKGTVTVGTLNAPNSVTVGALQSVKVVGQTVGAVQGISPAMAAQVLKNLKAPQQFTESDEGTKKKVSRIEQAKALALAKALAPDLFPEEGKVPEKKDKGRAGQEGQAPGGDVVLSEAASQIGAQVGDASDDLLSNTSGLVGQSSALVVSTTQQTQEIQGIVNPQSPSLTALIIPPNQTINTDLTFSSATHTGLGILDGTGTVTVTGLYDWQGGSMIGAGVTAAQGGLSIGGNVTLDRTLNLSGTSQIKGDFTALGAGTLANAGTLTKVSGALTATINPIFNNTGTVAVNSGTLALNGGGTSTGSFTVAGGSTLNFGGGTHAVSGVVSGAGALAVGGGLVTLSGANTYTGGTTVSAGVLEGTTTSLQGAITDNATVRFNQTTTGTYAGVLSGTGALEKSGTGTVTLSGANTSTGATSITGGTLRSGAAGVLADSTAMTVTTPGTLDLNGFNETIGSLAGSGNVTLGSATLTTGDATNTTFSGVMSGTGGLTKQGTGTFTLSGANTYSGTTTINAGTLSLSGSSALVDTGAVNVANAAGTLNLANSETIGSLTGVAGSAVTLNANTLTAGDATNTTFSGIISGTGGLTKAGSGTFTLAGANTYTGATSVSTGTLRVTNAAGLGSATGATTVGSGATLELDGNITVAENVTLNTGTLAGVSTPTLSGTLGLGAGTNTMAVTAGGDTLTLSGVLSGTGDLNKTGAGTLAIANTGLLYRLNGKTTVSGGTLSTTGDLVSIPTGETLTVTDTMLHANGGVLDVDQSVIQVPFTTDPVGIVQANGTNPLILLTGGTHTLASTAGTAMFDIAGNPANTATQNLDFDFVNNTLLVPPPDGIADGVSVTTGTDRPLRGSGGTSLQSTLLEASGATVSGEKLLKVDAALLEATVPIVRLLAASTLTLNADAVTLANMAKMVAGTGLASAMFALDGSSMTINVGALINASGGSYLSVLGDLVRLSNSSTLTLNDTAGGFLLRVGGGSVVDVAGALVDFTGAGNKVRVNNTVIPTLIGGVPVSLTGGALASQVQILGTPLSGLNANGTIENLVGVSLCPGGVCAGFSLIEVNGTSARVRIKGN